MRNNFQIVSMSHCGGNGINGQDSIHAGLNLKEQVLTLMGKDGMSYGL